jgi:hypothetical protein
MSKSIAEAAEKLLGQMTGGPVAFAELLYGMAMDGHMDEVLTLIDSPETWELKPARPTEQES